MKRDSVLAQRLAWFRSGLILAAMLGLGIVGLNDAAFARAGETLNAAPRAAVPDGAIVVADKDWKGGKNKGSNWNKNKNKNWSGNKNWHPNYNKHYNNTGAKAGATITTTGTRIGTGAPMCATGTADPITASSSAGLCSARS
jgi:hypothetical protein